MQVKQQVIIMISTISEADSCVCPYAPTAGTAQVELEVAPGSSTLAVVDALQVQLPQLEQLLPRCALAVNGDYVECTQAALSEGDEVALLPPMSGG